MKSMKNEEAVSPVIGVILMVAITVILAAVIAVFVFGMGPPAKAPQAQLKYIANGTTLFIEHDGGDSIILNNSKITIRDASTGQIDNGTVGVLMYGTFTNSTGAPVSSLAAGQTIQSAYNLFSTTSVPVGTILRVSTQDVPSGQMFSNLQVTTT